MKGSKASVWITLAVAAAMMLAANGYGAVGGINSNVLNMVGSSAQYQVWGEAARLGLGATPKPCGTHIWTFHNGVLAKDNRKGAILEVTGDFWIVWDGAADGSTATQICTYTNIDSGLGVRMFMASPRGTIDLNGAGINCAAPPVGGNLVVLPGQPLPWDEPLPTNVCNAAQGAVFNAAVTDIRPEDALFATRRMLNSLGYGPGPISPVKIQENPAYGSKVAQAVDFNLSAPGAKDPISGNALPRGFTTLSVGAGPMIFAVNNADATPGGFGEQNAGSYVFQNVNRFVLAHILDGTLTQTSDILDQRGHASHPLQIVLREPFSGTYNTTEFCIPNSVEIETTQENCVDIATNSYGCGLAGVTGTANPLDFTYPDGSTRARAIGTGDMVKAIVNAANPDGIGYAFWGFGNFGKVSGPTGGSNGFERYLQVDGVDPIFQTYTNGLLPQCLPGPTCPGALTFPHVQDGTYPVWSVLRIVTDPVVPAEINGPNGLLPQLDTVSIPDFVPIGALNVFRSHFAQVGVAGGDGICAGSTEKGGDEGGAVFTRQADLDYCANYGAELIGYKQ